MKAIVAVLLLLAVIGIGADPQGTCPSVVNAYVDVLRDTTDCTKFYYCVLGSKVVNTCPDGLHFNAELNVCDWPANARCSVTTTESPSSATPTTPTPTQSTTTPAPDCGECLSVTCPYTPGLFPEFHQHPTTCGRYCICDNYGTVHDMPCPDGLHFNTYLNVCDWPENAGCVPGSTPPPTSGPTSVPDCGKCDSVTCPYVPGQYPVFHPHPEECGRYCICDNYGTVHDMPCPDGLHFNPELDVCDWPEAAGCEGGSGTPSPTPTVTPTIPATDCPTTDGPTTSTPGVGTCSTVDCPYIPGKYPEFFPNPSDCGRYCMCDYYSQVFDMPCPPGLHWNPNKVTCDYPADAGCDSSATTIPTPTGSTGGGSSGGSSATPTVPTQAPDCGKCESVTCPYIPGDFPVFHPHPEECGRYCECDNYGTVHDMPCPPGLHWNPNKVTCDYPADAGCDPSATTIPTPTGSTGGGSSGGSSATPTVPTQAPDCGKCESVTCPYIPGDFPVFHPHPEECGRYCKCDNYGTVHDMPCPPGLHWNPNKVTCDYPADAGCDPSATTIPTPTGSTGGGSSGGSSATPTVPTQAPDCGKCVSVTCPYTPGDFPVFHPHPEECGRYCKCDNYGTVHDMPCNPGLHWNPNKNVCDYPADAGCDPSATTIPAPTGCDPLKDAKCGA